MIDILTELNYRGYERYCIQDTDLEDGVSYRFKFENQYGASVVKHSYSYGGPHDLFELSVLYFGADLNYSKGSINYNTDIADDIIPYLTNAEVIDLLERIKNLDSYGRENYEN